MNQETRNLIKGWRKISKRIDELCDVNCKGINPQLLSIALRTVTKTLNDLTGKDGVHINEVADHFGVSSVTIRKYLDKYGIPQPSLKEDETLAYIPLKDFEKLKEIIEHTE